MSTTTLLLLASASTQAVCSNEQALAVLALFGIGTLSAWALDRMLDWWEGY
jgi:hypothetical protein